MRAVSEPVVPAPGRPRVNAAAGIALVLALVGTAIATFVGETQEDQTRIYWILALLILLLTAVVFGTVVARAAGRGLENAAKTGIVLSVIGLAAFVVFWSGIPVVLGTAGAFLGLEARRRSQGAVPTQALVAVILGILAIVAAYVVTVWEKF